MMPFINGVVLVVGSSLAGSIVAKVTVTAAVGLIAAWLARSNRAAVRHALLAAMFGVMLLLPIASFVMPRLHVGVPVGVEARAELLALVTSVDANPSLTMAGAGTRVTLVTPQASKLSPSNLLLAGWAAGAVLFLLPVVIGLWQIRSLRRSGLPWRRGQSVVEALAIDAGIHRRVEVLLQEALQGPMTCGVVRPAIVLPQDAENWNQEDLNRAIVHELEHVRRRDSLSRCLARTACAVYWFHPLVWIAWRRLMLEAERSCDDAVLGCSEATAYADQLVGLAKRLSMAKRSPLVAMASRVDLATRVGAVLDVRQRRGRAGTFLLVMACAAAVVLVCTLSSVTLVAEPQAASAQNAVPKFEVVSIRPCGGVAPVPGGRSGGTGGRGSSASPGRINWNCTTVMGLMQEAYVMNATGHPQRIAPWAPSIGGGPAWINSDRYTISAKAEGNPGREMMNGPMLQALLEDRFKLKMRRETREVPAYELTVAKGGHKMQLFREGSCVPIDLTLAPPAIAPGQRPCGVIRIGVDFKKRTETVEPAGLSLSELSVFLSRILDHPVIDKTGTMGLFDFHLEFAVDESTPGGARIPPSDEPTVGPSIFTAVQEQLGLKLGSAKGPVEFLIVDHVEKPSEN